MGKKTSFVTIRITPETRKQITQEAKKDGRSVSNFLQVLILKALNDRVQSQGQAA